MAESMTGYGRGEKTIDGCRFLIEIKSVNNRFGDVQVRSPRVLMFLESKIKDRIIKQLVRGKIDVFITMEDQRADGADVSLNQSLSLAYSKAISEISSITGREDSATAQAIARFPEVITPSLKEWPEELLEKNLFLALDEALAGISDMRRKEGESLLLDLKEKIALISDYREQVLLRAPLVPEEYKKRLSDRMQELLSSVSGVVFDEGRKELELAVFADKCSIDEELVRLDSHLRQLLFTLESDGSIGKKLDFLLQEVNREVNTIGSKGNDLTISGLVVDMKAELEKIREQVQNLV